MQRSRSARLRRVFAIVAVVLVLKVTLSVVIGYRDYFPANFDSDFLSGRQAYFAGAYQWAFYAHIISGPITLMLGLLLISGSFRQRFPAWHRSFGKAQVALILLLLAPSGLWMAGYASTGAIAGVGFALLAIATGLCALAGWQTAVQRRFAEHRRWMWRCFLLLCSAVIVRIVGGMATVMAVWDPWIYQLTAWGSWLVPLAAFELMSVVRRRMQRSDVRGELYSATKRISSAPRVERSSPVEFHRPGLHGAAKRESAFDFGIARG